MLNVCLEMKLLKYGFVGLLLLASALFIVVSTQSQVIFGQGANTTNTTDSETPAFDGQTPGFTPKSEDGAAPPPPPADATTVAELPKETLVKDPDSDALSIGNRTEILELLPANSTKIIKFVDDDLKNSTGVGLAPTDVLEKLTSNANDNKSILSLATPEEVKQIESVVVNTTSAPSEEDDEVPVANATSEENANATSTNATDVTGGATGNEEDQSAAAKENANATSTNATDVTGGATGNEEDQSAAAKENANATNATDATGDEQGSTGDQGQQSQSGDKPVTGEEQTNITNATSAIEPNVTSAITGDEQGSTGDQGQQSQSGDEQGSTGDQGQQQAGEVQQAQTGEEPPLPPITNATNATAAQAPGMLNASNITGIPDEAGSEDDNSGANDKTGNE
jgi:hypothetical protein